MKWIKIVCTFLCVFLLLLSIDGGIAQSINSMNEDNGNTIDRVVFPHDQVVDVYIDIEEEDYNTMVDNAMSEETVMADINYNGYSFSNVGIRPKGNSSLKSVANSDSERFSLDVDLDYYIDDQSLYGITKLNLNNLFSDPTMMAEYLGYEMLEELDADASRTTFVALYINDEYHGLYLSVEQVDEAFLKERYGNANGELYKPEMGIGSDLAYISDDGSDYTGLEPKNSLSDDNEAIIELIKSIEEGSDLEDILEVDSFLKYLAMSTVTVHMDSYQSGMFHNYYLYNNNGVFEWISWDLNMIFNGFTRSGLSDEAATKFLIDEPVMGAMENYPLIEAIFENEEYVERYHDYIEILLDGYLSEDQFTDKVMTTYEMIKDYVEIDPTSFYTYDEFEEALFQDTDQSLSLLSFASQRSENIREQLAGTAQSSNDGQGNAGTGGGNMRGGGMDGPPPMENGNQGGNKGGMMNGLPPDINIEDIPEELREYFENGEMPPREKIMEFADELPEGLTPGGRNLQDGQQANGGDRPMKERQGQKANGGGPQNNEVQGEQSNTPVSLINIGLLAIMSLGMIWFTYHLKRK